MLGFLQKIGKALMLPIAVMPAAALLLRLGQPDLLNIPFMASAGNAIFANLAILFAIGVAIGIAHDQNGAAGLAGAIGYFVLTEGTKAINENINMAVLGGILTGVIAGYLYNRFHNIKLPEWLGFFGGRRFVPIATAATMVVLAGLFGFIWPPIQSGINQIGEWIINGGALGVGIFGFLNRLLIPVGLHHVLNSLVWFVFGEFNGATGDINRFFAGDPEAGIFQAGFFPIMMFGLPAACLAMIATAQKAKRKQVTGMLVGIAFTSFLTGITEPIEFSFMFLSPILYGVHALLTASSMMVAYLLDIRHGFGFSAGAIDFFLNLGIAQRPWLLFGVGLVYGIIYFVIFYFLIKILNLKTPGREDEEEDAEFTTQQSTSSTDEKYEKMGQLFLNDLGGQPNIVSIENCTTRLRLKIKDHTKVNEAALKSHGAKGVIKVNNTNLQVIVGTNVEFVANAMKQLSHQKIEPVNKVTPVDHVMSASKSEINKDDFVMPIEGEIIPLSEIPDPVFSQKMMGDGFGIVPTNGVLYSPVDGVILNLFPTKHAIGIRSKQGFELLIHVGLETVNLNGKGFELHVQEGEEIVKGQKLMTFDLEYIKENATSTITPVIFTNLQNFQIHKQGSVKNGVSGIVTIK